MSDFIVREHCPACSSSTCHTLLRTKFAELPLSEYLNKFYRSQGTIDFDYLERGEYVLVKCEACGLIYQQEIPNDELMYLLYEKWIDPEIALKLHESYGTEYYMKHLREFANVVSSLGDVPASLRCLDFGMGWGLWCKMAMGFGCDVYGIELSQARKDYAESHGVRVLSYDDIKDYKFDFINTEQVFEHIPNPLETLTYLKGGLAESGLIKISVPDGWNVSAKINAGQMSKSDSFRGPLISVQPLEHINSFNYKSLVSMAEKAGLRVVEVPQRYTYAWRDLIKSLVRPVLHKLRGSKSTRVYFTHA